MIKLELNELKGYLGTGLKMIFEGKGGRIIELQGIYQTTSGVTITDGNGGMWLEHCGFKPILHPLSDLTKYCDDLGFIPSDLIDGTDLRWLLVNDINEIKLYTYNWLLENHFDIHNWIPDNLAIDINTLIFKLKTNMDKDKTIPTLSQTTVISSINWDVNFQKIISKCSEARAFMLGSWWHICEFELDCGLFRLDVMGRTEVHHYDDLDKIEVDGIEYTLDAYS